MGDIFRWGPGKGGDGTEFWNAGGVGVDGGGVCRDRLPLMPKPAVPSRPAPPVPVIELKLLS